MKTYISIIVSIAVVGCASAPEPVQRHSNEYQTMPTTHYGERLEAKVLAVQPVYEFVVVGKDCNPVNGNVICRPLTRPKATANSYVAEFNGKKFSGTTYRPLRVGDKVQVNVVTSLNPAE